MAVVTGAVDGVGAEVAVLFCRAAWQRPVASDSEGTVSWPVLAGGSPTPCRSQCPVSRAKRKFVFGRTRHRKRSPVVRLNLRGQIAGDAGQSACL